MPDAAFATTGDAALRVLRAFGSVLPSAEASAVNSFLRLQRRRAGKIALIFVCHVSYVLRALVQKARREGPASEVSSKDLFTVIERGK